MINVELYIETENVFDNGVNEQNINFSITDNNKNWITNQWLNYYVRILSGTGIGQEASITSNNDTKLFFDALPIAIDTDSVYEIYAMQYNRVELYNDEKISITQTLQNSNDIGKLFTDYSQSFTIPASVYNNKLFKHWYNTDIDDGYDHRIRQNAYIEIDTIPFKKGNIQLEKVNKKNGFIDSYSLTFYGNLTQLKDKFKDIKLKDLVGWNTLNHNYNSDEVKDRIIYFGYPIHYPLIGSQKKYYYKNGIADEDITLTTSPVIWNDLFPACSVDNVFQFIQDTFGIIFNGSFFNLAQWTELCLYLKNAEKFTFSTEETRINFTSVTGTFPEMDLTTDIFTMNWNYVPSGYDIWYSSQTADVYITPTSGFENKVYTVRIYKDNALYRTYNQIGYSQSQLDAYNYGDSQISHEYYITVSCQSDFEFTTHFETGRTAIKWISGMPTTFYETKIADGTVQSIPSIINIQNYVPDIKVSDFVTGIIKAFNLMVIPTDLNTFEFIPLESYYNKGKITDITEYVYSDEMEVDRPTLYKSINFEYEKSTNILNNAYKGLYNKEYGDLIYNSDNSNESETYEIKLPFENILFEKTINEDFETATIVDKDLKPYIPKPILMYVNDVNSVSTDIKLTNDTGGVYNLPSYKRFSNELNSLPSDTTLSHLMTLNFNNEQSPWYNVIAPQGLYYRFYNNYVDNLYNIKTRNIKVKAILPPSLLTSIALNDRLIISGKRYIINQFTTDLTTGESDFDLITDYRNVNASSTVGYRFASIQNGQIDIEAKTIEIVIYLNDFEKFDVLSPIDFLDYAPSTDNDTDINLIVDIPRNPTTTRNEAIGIAYYRNGAIERTEYILITQTDV